ncbi:cell division initiation protein [Streptomyces sp. AM 4-1-1]|uniref:cell division initiation protein n=1 Tax=unclassified Streptomyces TaxID=2593676 RepID=UPI0023BA09E8|nr:cell division initiation protein [Streptomyces sp. AM 4-1-1]WEH36101.1 cell division initiation protein [Streptomyces sp. AM 4-1-1]
MDVQKKLDEIVDTVGSARSMPMSASCVVNRAELLAMLAEVRDALPGSLAHAEELIGGREQLVEQARQEAERIIESARAQRGTLVSDTEIARRSQDEADRILAEARREADEIRTEADEYVDSKLANFEVVLTKTIGSVDRGREKLLGRGQGLDGRGHEDPDFAEAPERSTDPGTLQRRADEYVDTKLGAFEAVLAKTLEAVGRGRQKLQGRVASDDLGAHMAAQDAAGGRSGHTSDADYLAGLAEISPEPSRPGSRPQYPAPDPIPAQAQPQYAQTYAYQDQPHQDGYGYQQPDPYSGYQQQGYEQGGHGQFPEQAHGQQHEQYHPQEPAPEQEYGWQQQPPLPPHPPQPFPQGESALDETSLFDTSMIDLEQLRRYEQER